MSTPWDSAWLDAWCTTQSAGSGERTSGRTVHAAVITREARASTACFRRPSGPSTWARACLRRVPAYERAEEVAALDASELGGREQDDSRARQLELGLAGLVQLLHRVLLEACGYSNGTPSDTMGRASRDGDDSRHALYRRAGPA